MIRGICVAFEHTYLVPSIVGGVFATLQLVVETSLGNSFFGFTAPVAHIYVAANLVSALDEVYVAIVLIQHELFEFFAAVGDWVTLLGVDSSKRGQNGNCDGVGHQF